ncbi:acyl carrier protein [Granulicatella sp. zg-ZJ]|nr:acyl carrier protein [Carnobacteriaceae bacterium zg-ZUI78]NEW62188.1 acyl carrier protein [Granulicatella sp. zg-ZJ]NEW66632.1 acyl carrier protein [Granulicatella sp. zg-84]QMI85045.1 acyl carrier protein [Carnobacteriaceae bacterium zg-84]
MGNTYYKYINLEEYIMTTTFEKIQDIIVEQLDKEKDEVTLETNFKSDLDADSLDLFQVINDIEDTFDVKIDTDENIETVSDLVAYVEEQLNN